MVKINFIILALCLSTCVHSYRVVHVRPVGSSMSPTDTFAFTQGLIQGLHLGDVSTNCVQELQSAVKKTQAVYTDLDRIIAGDNSAWPSFGSDMQVLLDTIQTFNPACNFDQLQQKVKSLTEFQGWVTLVKNFYVNQAAIQEAYTQITSCNKDFKACGENYGKIISLEFDWSLGNLEIGSNADNFKLFVDGLLIGLANNNANNQCVLDLESLSDEVDKAFVFLEQVATGDYMMIPKLYDQVIQISLEANKYTGECNLPELMNILETLDTQRGWLALFTNYLGNQEEVDDLRPGIENCSADYAICGNNLGNVIRLVMDWGIQ